MEFKCLSRNDDTWCDMTVERLSNRQRYMLTPRFNGRRVENVEVLNWNNQQVRYISHGEDTIRKKQCKLGLGKLNPPCIIHATIPTIKSHDASTNASWKHAQPSGRTYVCVNCPYVQSRVAPPGSTRQMIVHNDVFTCPRIRNRGRVASIGASRVLVHCTHSRISRDASLKSTRQLC